MRSANHVPRTAKTCGQTGYLPLNLVFWVMSSSQTRVRRGRCGTLTTPLLPKRSVAPLKYIFGSDQVYKNTQTASSYKIESKYILLFCFDTASCHFLQAIRSPPPGRLGRTALNSPPLSHPNRIGYRT